MRDNENKISGVLIQCILMFSIFIFFPFQSWTQEIEIKTDNGVIVVSNPNTPSPSPEGLSILKLKRDLIIGANSEKEDYWFSSLNSIAVDDSGNIYTLDPKEVRIRVYNPQGKMIKCFGRRGQGPGEFRGPAWLRITPGGELIVYDVLNRRFTYMALDGTTIKTLNAKSLPFGKNDMDSKGNIYIHKIGRGPDRHEDLIKLDPSFINKNTFHSFEKKSASRRVINPFPVNYYFTVTKSDKFIWILSSSYTIHIFDNNGKEIKRIVKEHTPVKITERDKEWIIKTEYSQLKKILQLKFKFPKYYPVATDVVTDDQERIYIRTNEKDGQERIFYDVFSPEGRYFIRFSLNEKEKIEVVKNNRLYCKTVSNADGIPLVTRYKLEWK